MPARNPEHRKLATKIATIAQYSGGNDPRLSGLRRDLRAERIKAAARRELEQAPPLTDAQRQDIATLFWPAAS